MCAIIDIFIEINNKIITKDYIKNMSENQKRKGRHKSAQNYIENEKSRRISFKKRRIGCIKNLMQVSITTGCDIQLTIYNQEDNSLLEYNSTNFTNKNILEIKRENLNSALYV